MRQIEVNAYGPPEVLQITNHDIPEPKASQVLIRVAAAGANRLDCFQRAGFYPPPAGASHILGLEVSGVVEAVGAEVEMWRPGDCVCALLDSGGYADYALAEACLCLPVPDPISLIDAAGLPEAAFTVWSMLWQRAALHSSETLLIQGGASGVGTFAVQLARALGHAVYATAGEASKCQLIRDLGATAVFNYKTQDFVAEVLAATAGRGVDVVLDMVGGSYLNRHLDVLAEDGRLVVIAFLGGATGEMNVARLLKKRLTVTASTLRSRSVEFKSQIAQELRDKVWPLLGAGLIRPVIAGRHGFDEAAHAHSLLEQGQVAGKLLLIP